MPHVAARHEGAVSRVVLARAPLAMALVYAASPEVPLRTGRHGAQGSFRLVAWAVAKVLSPHTAEKGPADCAEKRATACASAGRADEIKRRARREGAMLACSQPKATHAESPS